MPHGKHIVLHATRFTSLTCGIVLVVGTHHRCCELNKLCHRGGGRVSELRQVRELFFGSFDENTAHSEVVVAAVVGFSRTG